MPATVAHDVEAAVARYYADALARHGPTPRGVDWPSAASQRLRFATLLDGVDWSARPSLLDVGCGYGELVSYLDAAGARCRYVGYDIAPEMVAAARRLHGERRDRRFTVDGEALQPADVVVASGIFNVRLDIPRPVWTRHVGATIARLGALARTRLAFNLLPPPSSPALARDDLHYAEPEAVARYCRALFGPAVQLRSGYGLWEVSVIVDRTPP